MEAKPSLIQQAGGLFFGKIKLNEKDLQEPLFEFELALLEADVEQDTAHAITQTLQHKLAGQEVSTSIGVPAFVQNQIRQTLTEIMEVPPVSLMEKINAQKPFVILLLGPNGAGKTTTTAKLTHWLKQRGKSVVLASADTFRAGAIEQLQTHSRRLNARLVHHAYGADPAAVAFDAVKSAQARGEDVVLIDSAGRQDTNQNLLRELEKIVRVAKPHYKIYVGEAFSGQALLTQATEFNKAIGINGFILTKIDSDAKGGTAISLLHQLKKPILFLGTGQKYEDFIEFKKEYIIERVV
ncbi:MAG: signal recognition particle-docking protein FtsY [Candidatus Diapherotrites archaeon]|nr:signal recognition particle-docking protein FtsY [Candidatus Diapherotrites archaeon]